MKIYTLLITVNSLICYFGKYVWSTDVTGTAKMKSKNI